MLREPPFDILGDPGVERAVAAAEDVDIGHGGIIGCRASGLFTGGAKDQIVKTSSDPEPGLCHQSVKNRADLCQKTPSLCLNEYAENTHDAKAEPCGDPACSPFIYEQ